MDKSEMLALRQELGLSQEQFGGKIGLTRGTIIDYERGVRRSDGREAPIPKAVELACAALKRGITSYGEGPNRTHRADDRAYVRWANQQLGYTDDDLEEQGRRLFPDEWTPYPYAMIAKPEWDAPEVAKEVMRRAKEAGIRAEWRTLPVAHEQSRGWDLNVLAVVTPTTKDLMFFKLFAY